MRPQDMTLSDWSTDPGASQGMTPAPHLDLHCRRCRMSWVFPAGISRDLRRDLAEMSRHANILVALAAFKDRGFSFADAKWTILHVSRTPGTCNRCERPIAKEPDSVVCRCGSLNLNW
jgi:hypothetical protein